MTLNIAYQVIDTPLNPRLESPIYIEYEDIEEMPIYVEDSFQPHPSDTIQQRMMIVLLGSLLIVGGMLFTVSRLMSRTSPTPETAVAAPAPAIVPATTSNISPVFSAEVQHWSPQIVAWAKQFNLDPNMVATVMQIESCGDPKAQSGAGAMGLFQVMPFHFAAGEDGFNVDTNALRGMGYLVERLKQTEGDVGRAFAGYNGGHVAAGGSWDSWAHETQRYYIWSTGIYKDALSGATTSPVLQQWFEAGGASLCRQAANRLGL